MADLWSLLGRGVKAGSLCTGYGGLDLAVESVLDAETVWVSEVDRHACQILEARFPDVPNLGDLTAVDWSAVEPVDVLTAGFPCQPASAAGRRKGMTDERWLWDAVATAVAGVRPRRVLLENVPGLLSVDRGRAFERVVCDLAALGYVGRYGVVRASDAGAPHLRARVFIDASDAEGDGRHEGWAEPARLVGGPNAAQRRDAATDAGSSRLGQRPGDASAKEARTVTGDEPASASGPRPAVEWGAYRPAIERWEAITGRPAPRPTEPGRTGERLSPRFVEWMMGLPAGWVTDVPIPRNAQLKALGNGVVPQQAALALRMLLPLAAEAA